jgi:Zn-dependent peptidase ImmA (M78 family)
MAQKNEISNREVINLAFNCLQKYITEMHWKSTDEAIIDITEIYECVIYPEYDIRLVTDCDLGEHKDQKILGKMISDEKTILIDKSINQESHDPRFAFTLGHEIGHSIAHIGQQEYFRCTAKTFYDKQQQSQEFQANLFAEHLIMPAELVKYRCEKYYGTNRRFRYIGAGEYCFGSKKIYIHSLAHFSRMLARPLTPYFSHISKESLAYRMFKIGIIKNETGESVFDGMESNFCNSLQVSTYLAKCLSGFSAPNK